MNNMKLVNQGSITRLVCAGVILALTSVPAGAVVKLNRLFGHGAVLQRGIAVPVWGEAGEGEKVTVRFQDQVVSATAQAGRWMVRLKPLKAGGPFSLVVEGENRLTLTNIVVGEVWLCSGQSNMTFPLSRATNGLEAIRAAGDSSLRLFDVTRGPADAPQADVGGEWKSSSPETAAGFSAVAWFFGRDLRRALQVPVGLILSGVGGTPAEAWTSRQTLESDPELKRIVDRHDAAVKEFKAKKLAAGPAAGTGRKQKTGAARAPADPGRTSRRPCGLYNGMIAPLQPFAMAGVIWYQGEANSGRASEYKNLFPALIRDWRRAWNQGDFPFLFVQIAPHERMSPEIREAQLFAWRHVPATAMVVTTDVGAAKDIHPVEKEPVGQRLALAARAIAYGEMIEYSGPVYETLKVEGNRAILSFSHAGSGLVAKGGALKGFCVAGQDGQFEAAHAQISGDRVIVSSPSVKQPVAVRYGWERVPEVNLFNAEGLPASPFRTDDG
jgi:sialate O-acetylesterase